MGDLTLRRPWLPIALTIALVLVTVPHTAEDFHYHEFQGRFGIDPRWAVAALVLAYATQAAGIALAAARRRVGTLILAGTGAIWALGALVIHGPEIIASGPYRHGYLSKGLEVAIIGLGAAVVAACVVSLRRT